MGIRRDDFRQVRPTEEELAAWRKKHPRQAPGYRAEHKPCGTRIWYSGLAIGSHIRACQYRYTLGGEWVKRADAKTYAELGERIADGSEH